jgi:dipeptidase D
MSNNMNEIVHLEPVRVWSLFYEVTQIPRPSKQEEKIIAFLEQFASAHKLAIKKDAAGNVLISKPAAKGHEGTACIVLQSHVDMVCEKNSDVQHDFYTDPIQPFIDNGWVKAKGTTLGADDGIGVAMMLAVLQDESLPLGPIECLFTVDEETGLTGAFGLEPGFISGNTLINLDSEDEGEIFIGCAGGKDTIATLPYNFIRPGRDSKAFIIGITGLKGGHSGDDIHRRLGNAIKLLASLLKEADSKFSIGLSRFEGGNLRNAIPREAFASIAIEAAKEADFIDFVKQSARKLKEEFAATDAGIEVGIDAIPSPGFCLEASAQKALLNAMVSCPNGVIAWSKDIDGLVETSTNLASVKFEKNKTVVITTSQRSSSDTAKENIVSEVAGVFKSAGMQVIHSDGYPGWTPNMNSPLLAVAEKTYLTLFGKKPLVKAIHAGLECGLFLEKNPQLDMISVGPTIKGVHSPDERLEIATVKKAWDFLIAVLQNL